MRYGYLHLWAPPCDSLMNIQLKMCLNKTFTEANFLRKCSQVEFDMTRQYCYSLLLT
jgi:hypothetical protein